VPRSLWDGGVRDELVAVTESLSYGDVRNFAGFGGAVIDRRAFDRLSGVLDRLHAEPAATVLAGGKADDSVGYFVQPTVVESTDPTASMFVDEYFGPILAVHVYADDAWAEMLAQAEAVSPYALTGAVFAQDRAAILEAQSVLRFAAGNFHRSGRRPATVRRGAGVGHQRQGRLDLEPHALGVAARAEGDLRAGHRSPVPPHGDAVGLTGAHGVAT
jgi:1-pyrroline-5-carboxylate dehydrogenase